MYMAHLIRNCFGAETIDASATKWRSGGECSTSARKPLKTQATLRIFFVVQDYLHIVHDRIYDKSFSLVLRSRVQVKN